MNPTPITAVPSANLIGVDGCRSPSRVHSAAKRPDRTMTKIGVLDRTQGTGSW